MKNPPVFQDGYPHLDFKWTWHTPKGFAGAYSFGPGDQSATLPMLVSFNDFAKNSVVSKVLGYSWPDLDPPPTRLRRIPPMRHPIFKFLWCTRVAGVRFLTATGKDQFAVGSHMNYEWAILDLVFNSVNYRVFDDSEMDALGYDEWERYVERTNKSRTNAIQRQQGEYHFVEGPQVNESIPFGPSQLLSKTQIQLIWHDVPEGYLLDNTTKLPTKVYDARGKVNSTEFMGFPVGTLLMEDPDIRPRMLPINDLAFINLPQTEIPRSFDVTLNWLHFDPPYGGTYRGHNTLPSTADGLWYLVQDGGDRDLYPEIDFATIFDAAN